MELRFIKELAMSKPLMLVGLPGMGMVARTTVNYFIESLKPELFGVATSSELLQFLESNGVKIADSSLQISGGKEEKGDLGYIG